jgi:hypothetical protein
VSRLVALAILLLSGCASMKPQTPGEWAFHGANLVDVLQTINHGKDDCYKETWEPTRALLGSNPKPAEAIAWGVAVSALHRVVSRYMQNDEDTPRWAVRAWEATTFSIKGATIYNNYDNGIRLTGDNDVRRSGSNKPECQR